MTNSEKSARIKLLKEEMQYRAIEVEKARKMMDEARHAEAFHLRQAEKARVCIKLLLAES